MENKINNMIKENEDKTLIIYRNDLMENSKNTDIDNIMIHDLDEQSYNAVSRNNRVLFYENGKTKILK